MAPPSLARCERNNWHYSFDCQKIILCHPVAMIILTHAKILTRLTKLVPNVCIICLGFVLSLASEQNDVKICSCISKNKSGLALWNSITVD